MTATITTALTIETFIVSTAKYCKTSQPRHARDGAEAMVQLVRSGEFTADYLAALAEGIRIGVTLNP